MTTADTEAATIAQARVLYPLTGVSDTVLGAWYEQASAMVDSSGETWTYRRGLAICHLLGHYGERWLESTMAGLVLTGGNASAGVVTQSSSETLSLGFGGWAGSGSWTPWTPTEADLMQTQGGRAFLALRGTIAGIVAPVVL